MKPYIDHLTEAIGQQIDPRGMTWLNESCELLRASDDVVNDLSMFSAMARRRVGQLQAGSGITDISTPSGNLPVTAWTTGDMARVILILTAVDALPNGVSEIVDSVFRHGDEQERAIVVKSLVLYPEPAALKAVALETGRVNSLLLFSALVLDNPYPAACYSVHEFNQMILKSLFVGLAIDRVIGLQQRTNPELSRMCEDYIDERQAAGRTLPADIWLALAAHASPGGMQLVLEHLDHDDPAHRYYALRALADTGRSADASVQSRLRQRLALESSDRILELLHNELASA